MVRGESEKVAETRFKKASYNLKKDLDLSILISVPFLPHV